jgi:hypothetical protein
VHRYPVKDVSEGGSEKHHRFGGRPLAGQGLMYLLWSGFYVGGNVGYSWGSSATPKQSQD